MLTKQCLKGVTALQGECAVIKAQKSFQNWIASSRQIDSIFPLGVNEKELEEKSGLILQIDDALNVMFNYPANINGFMRMPNNHQMFDGSKPLDFIEREGIAGLNMTLHHVTGMSAN